MTEENGQKPSQESSPDSGKKSVEGSSSPSGEQAAGESSPPSSTDSQQDKALTEPAAAHVTGKNKNQDGGRSVVMIILALLTVTAIAISGYAFYLSYQLQALHSATAAKQEELSGTLDDLNADQNRTSTALDKLSEEQEATQGALQRLTERERMDNFDWAMAEVEYLTIVAMQRLNLTHDVDTALTALEAAAQRVKDIKNPGLIPVREQLTSDINALRAVPETDVAGMALYLGDLITRAEQLPLIDSSVSRQRPADDTGEAPVEGWRGVASAVWDELRQLVVIQREDDPPTELLAPDERYFLYQNLRIELASARAAALRRDTRNLRTSIELIQDWLKRYFNTDAEAVANIQESLAQMATVELQPELPDVSGSLESVRAWQRQRAEASGSGE